jgi:hypothetical protein
MVRRRSSREEDTPLEGIAHDTRRAMMARSGTVLAALILTLACSERQQSVAPQMGPDPSFQLSPELRATLRDGVNADALEELLQNYPRAGRAEFLQFFQNGGPHASIVGSADPRMNALLRKVWNQPAVAEAPVEANRQLTIALTRHVEFPNTAAVIVRRIT